MSESHIVDGINNLAYRVSTLFEKRHINYIFSPFGLHELLTLIFQDPGYDKDQLAMLLPFPEIELAPICYQKILSRFSGLRNVRVSSKAFLKHTYDFQDRFKSHFMGNFLGGLQSVHFNETQDSVNLLNLWIEDNSNKITSCVTADALENDIRLALLNVVSLEGQWTHEFNPENTIAETFYFNNNDTVEIPMMKMKAEVPYKHIDYANCQILQLPFSDNDLSMFIVLPDKNESLSNFLNNAWRIVTPDFDEMEQQEVNISLPKFKIETNIDLKDALNEIDFIKAVEDGNLFGMIESEEWLRISNGWQTGVINLHEKGSEVANGTIFTFVPSGAYDKEYPSKDGLVIYEMCIKSNISNRFAKNLVASKIKNTNKSAKDATVTVVLPETAFITEFVMEIDGKIYKSYIKEKEEAKGIYTEAVSGGRSAGIVAASVRDSNEFDISVNLESEATAVFSLTYEEMLQRVHDQYELVLNVRPGQIVENLHVEVSINESRPLKFVKTPALRTGTEMCQNEEYLKPSADIKINSKSAVVKFSPNTKQQKKIAGYLGTNMAEGVSGQFVVQYDVEREPYGGEILVQDGYFVHFFAANDLDPISKHVVFILDTSTSMCGRKISQLKDAMMSILNEVRPGDLISILEFNTGVIVWDISSEKSIVIEHFHNSEESFEKLKTLDIPPPVRVTDETIRKAKNVVQKIEANGYTYMIGGLETGLFLVQLGQEQDTEINQRHQPIIIFLTDGEPNVGVSSTNEIVRIITMLNFKSNKIPIFSLSFGCGADKTFLRQLSSNNLGFSRHIYEASDASLQLQAFYKQISSPLLTDVKFNYNSDVKELTSLSFPIYFRGSEIVVSGKCTDECLPSSINCCGVNGSVSLNSTIAHSVSSLERFWAYLTVKQLLEDETFKENNPDLVMRATEIALKYSFVTEVTSLVVVKPDGIDSIGDEESKETTEQSEGQPKKKAIRKRVIKKARGSRACSPDALAITLNQQQSESLKKIPQFTADHPFLVILRLKKGDLSFMLFVTYIHKPS